MTPAFGRFLNDALAGRQMFAHDGPRLFVRAGKEVTTSDVRRAEERMGVVLPDSYVWFLLHCGIGEWCGEMIPHPDTLYAFGPSCWEAAGFVTLVHDVRGVDEYVAMNPADPQSEGEQPVFYCCQDPFGFARVADSFEHWAYRLAEEGRQIYRDLQPAILASWQAYKSGRPTSWYQSRW